MYRLGELHRCRGDSSAAEEAYRQAGEWGYDPQPGLALLRLAQGRTDAAVAAITRAVDETNERARRGKLLPAFVEVTLAAGDVEAARRGADELAEIAGRLRHDRLGGRGTPARGARCCSPTADARAALVPLREAVKLWRQLGAPYDEARARVVVAQACRAVGDEETAALGARSRTRRLRAARCAARAGAGRAS